MRPALKQDGSEVGGVGSGAGVCDRDPAPIGNPADTESSPTEQGRTRPLTRRLSETMVDAVCELYGCRMRMVILSWDLSGDKRGQTGGWVIRR